ncbi:hypothetical protein AA313_de0206601 [Arthrobotrys entomopaga]|nr:hypothetical protein AA313_de0206601 [Arthrobotrys entomopaga]
MKRDSFTTLLTITILTLQFHLTHSFYIWLAQQNQPPAVQKVYYGRFHQCYPIHDRNALIIGLAIYNVQGQTYFPGGIQLYQDPHISSSCDGEPKTIITLAPRVGVTYINLAEMGLADKYTSWRIYEVPDDRYKLSQLPELQEKGMSVRNKIFEKRDGEWSFVTHLRDFPLFKGGYPDGYYERYSVGEVTDFRTLSLGRPGLVNDWIERQLELLVSDAQGDGIPRREDPAIEEEEAAEFLEIQTHKEPGRQGLPDKGSMDYVRRMAEQGLNPEGQILDERAGRANLPLFQRTLEILKGIGGMDIPAPPFMFGLPYDAEVSMDPDAIQKELDILKDQPEGNELELGWALLRQATNRQEAQDRFREAQSESEGYDYEEKKFNFDDQGEAPERQYYYGEGMNMREDPGIQDDGLSWPPEVDIQGSNIPPISGSNELQPGDQESLRVRDMQDTPAIRIVEPMRGGRPTKYVYNADDIYDQPLIDVARRPPPQLVRGSRRGGIDYDPFGDGRGLGSAIDDETLLDEHMRKMRDSDDSSDTYIGDQETVFDEGEPSPQMEEEEVIEPEPNDQMEAGNSEQLVERAAAQDSRFDRDAESGSDAGSYEPRRFIGYQSPQVYSDISERNRMMELEQDFMNRDSRGNSINGQEEELQQEIQPHMQFHLLDSPESYHPPQIHYGPASDIDGILDVPALLGELEDVDLQDIGRVGSHPSTESELSDLGREQGGFSDEDI